MFIASLICLILGILTLIASVVVFIKLGVREAWMFLRNKKTGKKNISYSSSRKRKRHKTKTEKKNVAASLTGGNKDNAAEKLKSNIGNVVSNESAVKTRRGSDGPTYALEDDSESPTGLLDADSEAETSILVDDSESPTGLLEEDSESPTGLLDTDSEAETSILEEDSENPTGLLEEDSESPTGLLDESQAPIQPIKKKQETPTSDFRFTVVKDVVVVHTDESIQ